MKISIILGHPTKGSFSHAIAEVVRKFFYKRGDKIFYHDLYEEKFSPVLTSTEISKNNIIDPVIQRYCDELSVSDGIIIIHPNWWGQPPAILKGWVDRVIRYGVAYKFTDSGEGLPIGLLKAQYAVVFNTSDTPSKREQTAFGDPLEQLWKKCIFEFCGVKKFHRKMYGIICISTPEQRKMWLKDVRETLKKAFP